MDDDAATEDPRCSAKGCRAPATTWLSWRNPRIHQGARRKQWLACAEHEASLAQFLDARGFLLDRGALPAPAED